MKFERLYVLGCRIIAMLVKFLFIFLIAKLMSTENFSSYIIISSLITFLSYIVGLDYYNYSNRELISTSYCIELFNIKNHISLLLVNYCILFVVITYTSILDLSAIKSLLVIYIILSENISLEVSRILNIKQQFVKSATLLVMRVVPWTIGIIVVGYSGKSPITLFNILSFWALSSLLSCFFSFLFLNSLFPLNKVLKSEFSSAHIIKGLKISALFLLATFCLRGFFVFDKQFLSNFSTSNYIALYGVVWSLTNGVIALVESGLIVFKYPLIISLVKENKISEIITCCKELILKITLIYASFYIFFALFGFKIFNYYIWKESNIELGEFNALLSIIMLASYLYSFSNVPHYVIYAKSIFDKYILLSTILSFLIFILSMLVFKESLHGVALSMLIGFLALFIFKATKSIIILRRDNNEVKRNI